MEAANRCPVCQARFRGARFCSRCGVDLGPLMTLVARAWKSREAARHALGAGDFRQAEALAAGAQKAHATPEGDSLRLLGAWLNRLKSEYFEAGLEPPPQNL